MKKKLIIVGLITLFSFILISSYSTAEMDKTRRMKAKAEYYFEKGEYYKAIDIWAEVLKIDSYDKEALWGIAKSQEVIEETRSGEEERERKRLKELIQEGKNYSRDREYKKALSSWGQALSIDPTNKEVLDLIEEARIRAQYEIGVLDKLKREKRFKTPHIDDLDKIANKMISLLEKADVKVRKKKRKEIEKEVKEEAIAKLEEEKDFIKATFTKGEGLYKEGRFKEAISEWNKILPYLPKSSMIAVKIAEFKEKMTAEEKRIAEEELRRKEEIERKRREGQERGRLEEEWKKKARIAEKAERLPGKITWRQVSGIWRRARKKPVSITIIGIIALLVLLLAVKVIFRTKIKPHLAKAPPKKAKKEEGFEPRDLKKFLKKKPEDEDKDLFK